MSGHSKWATTKHKKAATDAKRGKIFTKITKEITVAAKLGGGDPDGNPRLRTAVAKAKSVSMPAENIKRAIQKGTGELPGVSYEEVTYEGYGPNGVAIIVEVLTDNRNRTVSEIRNIFSKAGGNMGEAGCVSWMFHKKGYIVVARAKADEEKLMSLALDAGAEDMQTEDDNFVITTAQSDFEKVKKALEDAGIPLEVAEVTMVPQTYVKIDGEKVAGQMMRLMEAIEDNDDVQNVYANFDIPEEVMNAVSA
ncbi:MAG: YebC/PmpR family DNA-binding transcriptional regulator [Nitrospirae bacterium]|nr:YebC/PmpR family DNA-binding transcriptional regulator [Nitrospirota bacterium]NTW67078.1 YebC/PmpR family DNA-binding transcriptional regulator [Nitrospirota bacterium]